MKSRNSYWYIIFIGLAFIIFNFWYQYHMNNQPLPTFKNILYWIIIAVLTGTFIAAVLLYNNRLKKQKKFYEDFIRNNEYVNEMNWKQIAGDLHDSLGQNLLVVNSEIKQLQKTSLNGNPQKLNELSDILINSVDEIRRISARLHPYHLERFGLKKALENMVNIISGSADIKFDISIENIDNRFQRNAEYSIYRIIQECINNITKHSNAGRVVIEIYTDNLYLNIKIADDGIGFDFSAVKPGLGLINMEQRVNNLKGTIKINSGINEGTTIIVAIPVMYITISK